MKMQNIIIVLVKTVTNVEQKTANAVIFKKKKSANVYCNDCGQSFHGQNGFTAHKKKLCRLFKKCPECCKVYKFSKKKKHVCGEYRCPNCLEKVLPNHQCYIQPLGMEFSNLLDQVDDLNEEDRAILEDMLEAEAAEKVKKKRTKNHPRWCVVLILNVGWMKIKILRMCVWSGNM